MALALDTLEVRQCSSHAWYASKAAARAAVKNHLNDVKRGRFSCAKCYHDRRFTVWRCDAVGEGHWHTGHQNRQRGV
jgi:hypothetical protein